MESWPWKGRKERTGEWEENCTSARTYQKIGLKGANREEGGVNPFFFLSNKAGEGECRVEGAFIVEKKRLKEGKGGEGRPLEKKVCRL